MITDLKGGKFECEITLDFLLKGLPMFVFLTEVAEQLEVERTQAHPRLGKVATLSLEGTLSVRNEF